MVVRRAARRAAFSFPAAGNRRRSELPEAPRGKDPGSGGLPVPRAAEPRVRLEERPAGGRQLGEEERDRDLPGHLEVHHRIVGETREASRTRPAGNTELLGSRPRSRALPFEVFHSHPRPWSNRSAIRSIRSISTGVGWTAAAEFARTSGPASRLTPGAGGQGRESVETLRLPAGESDTQIRQYCNGGGTAGARRPRTHSTASRTLAIACRMPTRSFIGSDGRTWQAWDVVPSQHPDWPETARRHLPPPMTEGWLCFECGPAKRRIHPIPRGWAGWSEDELRTRCDIADPVARPAARGAADREAALPRLDAC